MPKLNLTKSEKQKLKDNFSTLNRDRLSKDEKRYVQLIENGKKSAAKNVRINGQYLSGEVVEIARKIADKKDLPLQTYINRHEKEIQKFINLGSTNTFKQADKAIDIIDGLKRKTVEVDTGNGIVRMSKEEAIEKLALFQQHVKSSTKTVMLATRLTAFKNGKIRLVIPEDYEDLEGEELLEFLNDFGIEYVESDKAGKKK